MWRCEYMCDTLYKGAANTPVFQTTIQDILVKVVYSKGIATFVVQKPPTTRIDENLVSNLQNCITKLQDEIDDAALKKSLGNLKFKLEENTITVSANGTIQKLWAIQKTMALFKIQINFK